MALPNGDLITTVFDPQMAYPVDKRMQVDTLNSRDSISMYIRWEGMTVYVLEDSKIYILQGGRSNEYWKELGTGTGTGGTTFVGQFATADLLPTSGRSAGDYAFVGTGDDFVQYNWDNIANEWVMAEGQTDMASEFFHIGYKTPLRRPVIFPLFPKDVLVEMSGDFVFSPETSVARFIFTGEVTAIRGIETAAADREIKLVNRTGSDIILRDKASGIPSGSGMDFGGTDYTWVNGSEITLKGNGTYWELAPNNQVAFSDHLDSVNAEMNVGSDGLKVWTGFIDSITKVPVTFKQLSYVPDVVDGRIFRQINGEYFGDAEFLETRTFNILKFGGDNTGVNFSDNALNLIRLLMNDGDKIIFPHGTYKFQNTQNFTKSVEIDFGNSIIIFANESTARDGFIFKGTLKSNHSVTSNYSKGQDRLTLNDVTGIEKGDLINVISSELYSSTRTYYWKGGNAKVTKITGNTVYFDLQFPFDMSNSSIEINVYNPISVKVSNINLLTSQRPLNNTFYGLRVEYGVNTIIENVNTENFKLNIDIYRCVDVTLNRINTGKAKNSGDTFDGYGVDIESSTNVTCNHVYTNSGQHGVTTSGREVNFNLIFNDCVMFAETWNLGFGAHENLYNITFNNCTASGWLIGGNVTMNNCYDVSDDLLTHSNRILTHDNKEYNNIIINGGKFIKKFEAMGGGQVPGNTAVHLGSLIINQCQSIRVDLNVNLSTSGLQIGDIGLVEFNKVDDFVFNTSDKIDQLNIINSKYTRTAEPALQQLAVNSTVQKISKIYINNVRFKPRASTLRILRSDEVVIDSIKYYGVEPSQSGFSIITDRIYITNTDMEFWLRGIENATFTPSVASFINTKLRFLANSIYTNLVSSALNFSAVNFYNYNFSTLSDIQTAADSSVYEKIIDGSGRGYIGTNALAYLSDIPSEPTRLERPQRNYTLDLSYLNRYVVFTYADGNSTTTIIPPDVFSVNDEIVGEIEGDGRTISAGTGVNLRTPTGQGLFAPTGSRFIIKFKSPNDALVTIIKPYASSTVPNASTTQRGIIEQATDAETITGTDTERAVSPANLQAKLNSLILSATATLDFPVIAAGETERLTATVTGAALLDPVLVSGPDNIYNSNNSTIDAWVSAANTVTVRVRNNGASSIDPGEGQFKIKVFK